MRSSHDAKEGLGVPDADFCSALAGRMQNACTFIRDRDGSGD
jgi:hypothetical protein